MGNSLHIKRYFTGLLLMSAVFMFKNVGASSIAGGDITWKCIGKDSFLITTTIFKVCDGLSVTPATIAISGASCATRTVALKAANEYSLVDVCRSVVSKCTDSKSTFQYGMKAFEFQAIIDVSDFRSKGCCDISVSYNKCCRYSGLTTVKAASSKNLYLESTLNICQNSCDNSVEFNSIPKTMIALGRDVVIDFGVVPGRATDSVMYDLVEPLTSASTRASWENGFSYHRPLSFLGFPKNILAFPRGFHVDQKTGAVYFRPMKIETSVITVRAKIYRSGKLIGSVLREQLVVVYKATSSSAPVISGINGSNSKSVEVCFDEKRTFNIYSSDRDRSDSTFLTWTTNITGLSISHIAVGQKDALKVEWTPSKSDTGRTDLHLVVEATDNACPVNLQSSKTFHFKVKKICRCSGTILENCFEL